MSRAQPQAVDPLALLRPRRTIAGHAAMLLPFTSTGDVDWAGFRRLLERTVEAGLAPAVNMDTGHVHLLADDQREAVLRSTRDTLSGKPFLAGAFVADQPGAAFDLDGYSSRFEQIAANGGTPVIMPSFGLTSQDDDALVAAYEALARRCDRFVAFELGTMFSPAGRIYSLEVYERLLQIPQCVAAKHSSLDRQLEWQRLALRNRLRPEFLVLTGNDLAIDMVMYGSDYLLGLATFAPDGFAARDRMWADGDPAFYELNDTLQYLGQLAFRQPTPAYRHSAAQFLKLRGWIDCEATHPASPTRPASDEPLLLDIAKRLSAWIER